MGIQGVRKIQKICVWKKKQRQKQTTKLKLIQFFYYIGIIIRQKKEQLRL